MVLFRLEMKGTNNIVKGNLSNSSKERKHTQLKITKVVRWYVSPNPVRFLRRLQRYRNIDPSHKWLPTISFFISIKSRLTNLIFKLITQTNFTLECEVAINEKDAYCRNTNGYKANSMKFHYNENTSKI